MRDECGMPRRKTLGEGDGSNFINDFVLSRIFIRDNSFLIVRSRGVTRYFAFSAKFFFFFFKVSHLNQDFETAHPSAIVVDNFTRNEITGEEDRFLRN